MNFPNVTINNDEKNPWCSPELNISLAPSDFVLISVFIFLSSLFSVIARFELFALIVCVFAVVMMIKYVKSGLLVAGLLIPAILLGSSTMSLIFPALFLSVVISIGTGTVLLSSTKKTSKSPAFFLLFLPVASYAAELLILKNPFTALISLCFYPSIILLSSATSKNKTRISAICHASIGLAISAVIAVGIIIFRKYGSISFDIVKTAIHDCKIAIADFIQNFIRTQAEALPVDKLQQFNEVFENLTSQDFIDLVSDSFFCYIPAFFIIACNVIGFFGQSFAANMLTKVKMEKFRTANSNIFLLSPHAAVVFLVSGIVFSISYCAGNEMVGIISQTLYMILSPGFLIFGIMSVISRLSVLKPKDRTLSIVIFILIASCMISISVVFLAIHGAITTLTFHFIKNKLDKTNAPKK